MALAETELQQSGSEALRALDWYPFEKLTALLFEHEGFVVQSFGGARADGGIDLLATKDGVTFGVQCKHWKAWRVGVKEVRAFFGALQDHKLRNGFLITSSTCSNDAVQFARRNGIDLLNETTLLENLEAVGWRSSSAFLKLLCDKRKICPKCEAQMVLRTAAKGASAGRQFWGCSTFPRCRFTIVAARSPMKP